MHPFSLEHGMKEKKGIHVSRTSIYKWQEQGKVTSGNVCILNMARTPGYMLNGTPSI
jgi:hypothetical protein